jgi:transglutaminase-like putative cysteine protease
MKQTLLIAFFLVASIAHAETPPTRSVRLTYTCYLTDLPTSLKPANVWIPMPISDEHQSVTLTTTDLDHGRITTEAKYGNRMYYRQLDLSRVKPTDTLRITLNYTATITERVVPEAKQLAPLPGKPVGPDMQVYLAPTRLIPLGGPIDSLRRVMNLPAQPILAARKLYDYLIDNMVYNYKAPGAGIGDVVWACSSKTGDCSDYHSVFIGVCRASGIPADHVFGIPFRKPGKGTVKSWHCWARYFVDGPGWATIDASEADKHPEQRDYLFGTLSNVYLTIGHGRDVNLMPQQRGPALNIFADPYVEIDGKPFAGVKWTGDYEEKMN